MLLYPFILDGVALNPKLNQADGMHPNPAGVKIIVARMLPYVKKLVAENARSHVRCSGGSSPSAASRCCRASPALRATCCWRGFWAAA